VPRSSSPAVRWASPGPHRVATAEVGAWSTAEGKSVTVLARYPVPGDARRSLPVIVFCHGLGGSHRSYAALGTHLASHGYAVLHPQFLDSFPIASAALGLTGVDERTWTRDERAHDAMLALLFDQVHWVSRAMRVHSVIDSLAGQRHLSVPLRAGEVIVAGHSYGAYTAQLVLGARLYGAGFGQGCFAHPAAAGGILLSPQGSGDRGLASHSWDAVIRALLVVTAANDLGPCGQGLAWRREPFDAASSRLKHLAVVRGGTHLLGDIDRPDPAEGSPGEGSPQDQHTPDSPVRDAVLAITVAFADRVGGDLTAGDWLASGPFPAVFEHEHWERVS
jgi:predicted dienelactone hydrolase